MPSSEGSIENLGKTISIIEKWNLLDQKDFVGCIGSATIFAASARIHENGDREKASSAKGEVQKYHTVAVRIASQYGVSEDTVYQIFMENDIDPYIGTLMVPEEGTAVRKVSMEKQSVINAVRQALEQKIRSI